MGHVKHGERIEKSDGENPWEKFDQHQKTPVNLGYDKTCTFSRVAGASRS